MTHIKHNYLHENLIFREGIIKFQKDKGVFGKIAEPFIKALKQINYDGFLSYEVCSPRYVKHTLIDFETLETEVSEGLKYLKGLVSKFG